MLGDQFGYAGEGNEGTRDGEIKKEEEREREEGRETERERECLGMLGE
jgi:hypothetical protein